MSLQLISQCLRKSTTLGNVADAGQRYNMPTSTTPQTVTFTSNNDVLQDLKFNASEFERVAIKVKLKDGVVKQGRKYKFDLIQRDEAGNVVGGETFQFNEGWVAINPPITIDPIVIGDGMIMLNAAVPEDNVSVNWTDETDSRIGRGSNITVKPTRHNDTFTVTLYLTTKAKCLKEA